METVSKTFPPLLWAQERFNSARLPSQVVGRVPWPFPVINGKRTEASEALLGTHNKPVKLVDTLQDFEEATW